ncbi:MAG: YlxM family DNA-binding protein [Erysipelotrichaceae bacterium]
MEKFDYINQLLPFYIDLLTEKQQEIVSLYYYENYSLSEIAQQLSVSRNAVYDALKKSIAAIDKYESLMHLSSNYNQRMHYYSQLQSLELQQVNDIVKQLIELED